MGTEFYLLRNDNETLFELGKGLVNAAFRHLDETPSAITDVAALAASIREAVEQYGAEESPESYPAELAQRVVSWAAGKEIAFRAEYHMGASGHWDVTGSRYIV